MSPAGLVYRLYGGQRARKLPASTLPPFQIQARPLFTLSFTIHRGAAFTLLQSQNQ